MAHVEALSPVSAGTVESWHAKDIESLLSEKLLEGYSLLDTSCPHCVTPLVKRKAPTMNFSPKSDQPVSKDKGIAPHISMAYVAVKPQPSSDSMVLSGSFAETVPFSPVSGVPFCVSCNAHVVTRDEDMIALERCHSLKDKGRIIVAIDEDRQDSTLEVRLPERPPSTLEMPASYAREEAEQENPAFDAIEAQHFFSERDASPLIEVNTSLKKELSPKNMQPDPMPAQDAQREEDPAFDDATEQQRDMAPEDVPLGQMGTEEQLDSIASKKPLGPHGSPSLMAGAFMCGEATQAISDDEPVISLREEASLPNKENDDDEEKGIDEPANEEEGIEQGIDEPADEEEGIEHDLGEHARKMESLGETAARFAMLPPKPVESDLLHPTEKEELDYKRAKSVPMEPTEKEEAYEFFTDEIMQEYSVRRDIATKVLGSKMLQGYSLVETQCLKCGMPLMEYQGQIDCVVCPVLVKKAKKKMKEQEEEKFLAEQKAKIEAEVAAQKKADEEAAAMVKAEQEAAVAKAKAEEEAAAKAAAEVEEAATKAIAAEEAKRMEAEEAAMRAAADEEAAAKAEEAAANGTAEDEAATLAADELELMFVFTDEDAFRMEEEARLAEEERLLEQARLAEEARVTEAVRIAEEEEHLALEALYAAEKEEQLNLQNVEIDADMDRDLPEIEINTNMHREQLAKEGLRQALEALHNAEEEGQLALEDGEEDSLSETITSTLTMEREALRAAEEEERLALQTLRDAEEEEQMALEALRAAEEEEQLALEAISAAEAEEKARLALQALRAAEEVERLALEAVRAEEEKILAEKALEDARIAEEQKKFRETEAMRTEQARIAYHARLEEEARRAAEIELAEKARIEAEEEMRREELEKQAEEEARLIEALEKEANEKSKNAEAAWLEAKAALDEVSSARRQILQKTIAQAEVEAVAEAEEIVSSQAEGFKEAPKLPPTKSYIEREQWETLRMEGRSVMTRRMLQGWTMLPELCLGKECANTPLLLSKDGRKVQCVVCDGCGNGLDGVYENIGYDSDEDLEEAADDLKEAADALEEELSNTGNLVERGLSEGGASVMSEKESFEEPPVPPTPTSTRAVSEWKDDFEAKRTFVSKEIGRKMMQGWTLLDMSCDECMMPLMHNPEQDEETCVLCGPTPRPLPIFQEPKSQARNDPPLDPPSNEEDEEELESNVFEEEKLDTDALEEEKLEPSEKKQDPPEDPLDTEALEEEKLEPSEKEQDPPEDPPTAEEDEEELVSNVFKEEKLDTDVVEEEKPKPSEKEQDPPEDPPTVEEDEEELESNVFEEEKLDTDAMEEDKPMPSEKEEESIATLHLPIEELNEETLKANEDTNPTNEPNIIEEDYAFEVMKALSPQSGAKPMYSEVDEQPRVMEEECAIESTKEPLHAAGPISAVSEVDNQPDTIEEQCAIEVEVVALTFDVDEEPIPIPTMPTEEVLSAGEVDKQSDVFVEEECDFELMPTAASFSAPSFDEAPAPMKKPTVKEPTVKKPMSYLDKEDRADELVYEKSPADEAPAPVKKPTMKKPTVKDRANELMYAKSPAPSPRSPKQQRPPRPMSRASTPPSPKHILSPKLSASARVKRGPPKPEGLSKSPASRSVPHSITARPAPMPFNHSNDDDGSNGSRMELIASSALDALLTRIDECKRNLNGSSDPNFIMTQLTMIEKLSSAAISMRKLEEMS